MNCFIVSRQTPPESYHSDVIERILELRDQPPSEVTRKMGPLAILYYLHNDKVLIDKQQRLARSKGTIWSLDSKRTKTGGSVLLF